MAASRGRQRRLAYGTANQTIHFPQELRETKTNQYWTLSDGHKHDLKGMLMLLHIRWMCKQITVR